MTRELSISDKETYEHLTKHPLQSWQWGEFRQKTGATIVRIGIFENDTLLQGFQISLHRVPFTNYTVGYFPKGDAPTKEMIAALTEIGRKQNALFIKLEPNIVRSEQFAVNSFPQLIKSPKPLFTKYTFYIDLTISEEELLKSFDSKTRYNIRLSQKKGVTIQEESSEEAFKRYLELTHETTSRQGFYAHNDSYHRKMWEVMHPAGIAHLLTARYDGKILTTWIVFLYKNVLYYPYGASSEDHKNVMASNLMMWETIRWGKARGATTFDLWGTPGPDPKPSDPYYGFHRFKMGYAPKLVEFVGTYDLVLKQPHYSIFQLVDRLRWVFLKLKKNFHK